MQKNEKGPLSHRKIKCSFLDYFQLLMIGQVIWAKNIDQNANKNKKGSLSHWKIKCSFGLHSTSDDHAERSEQKTLTKMQKNEKGPLSHWKIKCSFLDYVQLLMISRAIQVKNVNWNAKKQKRPPKSSKNQMFIFGLCSTFDDWPHDLSKKRRPKCKKTKKAP